MSAAQIAAALGLTRGQVLGKMHRLGLKTKTLPRKWRNTALIEKMMDLAGQRLSVHQIGKALGLTYSQARYRLGQLGLKTNPRTEWPAGAAETMIELIDQGLSNRQMAKALGLTLGQVINRLRRFGLKTKNAAKFKKGWPRKVAPLGAAA